MIDLSKVAKTTLAGIGALFRQSSRSTLYFDDVPEVPDGTRDALMWRIEQGHFRPAAAPPIQKIPLMTEEDIWPKWRG